MTQNTRLLTAIGPDTVPDLRFAVEAVEAMRHTAAPAVSFRLGVERAGGGRIESISLQVELRIGAGRRRYSRQERDRLVGLFGRTGEWSRAAASLHWTNVAVVVPAFEGATRVELAVGLTYDLEVAAADYFAALQDGEAPVDLLFSGTVFYQDARGRLQAVMLPWEKEARARMPLAVWRQAMDLHFPGSGWLRLERGVFDRLHAYRARKAFPTWEHAIVSLLGGDLER